MSDIDWNDVEITVAYRTPDPLISAEQARELRDEAFSAEVHATIREAFEAFARLLPPPAVPVPPPARPVIGPLPVLPPLMVKHIPTVSTAVDLPDGCASNARPPGSLNVVPVGLPPRADVKVTDIY